VYEALRFVVRLYDIFEYHWDPHGTLFLITWQRVDKIRAYWIIHYDKSATIHEQNLQHKTDNIIFACCKLTIDLFEDNIKIKPT
jgi:hypothetical protein